MRLSILPSFLYQMFGFSLAFSLHFMSFCRRVVLAVIPASLVICLLTNFVLTVFEHFSLWATITTNTILTDVCSPRK